tara:strand:+ start:2045 stop:2866 length:822 start_codon:yes stop_codon:yes gene_type:complete
MLCFLIFKFIGPNLSSRLSGKVFEFIGPLFRSKKIIEANIKRGVPDISSGDLKNISKLMWNNYGKVFAEYMFLKDFRYGKLTQKVKIEGQEILDEIKKTDRQVIFISGHFCNFELMAMFLEKNGIKLSAIYRPLNNIFLNSVMERIREKYICKHQIKKGVGGLKKLIALKKNNFSTALMIDQRVSEGILSKFFNQDALTTTIPAQLVKKYNIAVVPVYIERIEGLNFRIAINNPINFSDESSTKTITDKLNQILEVMILKKPEQWIWSHNRWK